MSIPYQSSHADKSAAFHQVKVILLPDQPITNKDAASYLGVSLSTLNKMRRHRNGPDFTAVMGKIFYYKKDLDEFLYYSWYSILNPSHLGQHNGMSISAKNRKRHLPPIMNIMRIYLFKSTPLISRI